MTDAYPENRPPTDQHASKEEKEIAESPSAKAIHGTIFKEAEYELSRGSAGLFWSGLAAGSSMSFSMIAEGLLESYLPDSEWSMLVSNLGYSLGFIIVIFGKQQLFTENTLTPVIPLLYYKDRKTLVNVMRLWGVVLIANLLGAFLVALVIAHTSAFSAHAVADFVKLGLKAIEPDFGTTLVRGIFAGWLIALMVWLLPSAKAAKIWIIIFITYIIGIGHFSHVIAGATEVFTLAALNEAAWGTVMLRYLLPTLLGNIIGGVVLVAAVNHAQIQASLKQRE